MNTITANILSDRNKIRNKYVFSINQSDAILVKIYLQSGLVTPIEDDLIRAIDKKSLLVVAVLLEDRRITATKKHVDLARKGGVQDIVNIIQYHIQY